MAQHMAACHGVARGGPRRGRRRLRMGGAGGLDVAPSRERPVPGDTIDTAGEDRIGIFEVASKSSLFKSYSINSGTSLRLRVLSQAYQRMKWEQCVVRVVPQAPLTTKGGYVCGFIRDPDDAAVTAEELSAAQGSITKKWYETAIVPLPRSVMQEWFYTSEGPEPRTSSPGKFWIISEGAPSDNIDVVVTFNWRVKLTQPTVEHVSDLSFISDFEAISTPGKKRLTLRRGTEETQDFTTYLPDSLKGTTSKHAWRVPSFTIQYKEGTGDTGTYLAHFVVYDPSDKTISPSNNGKDFLPSEWQSDVAREVSIPCNTVYKYVPLGGECVRNFRQTPHRT